MNLTISICWAGWIMDMNLAYIEALQRRLWEFAELATSEKAPSVQGRAQITQMKNLLTDLETEYLEPRRAVTTVSKDSSAAPTTVEHPEPRQAMVPAGEDNWFVGMFHEWNLDSWNRKPGDRLTLRQKVDIVGESLAMLLLVMVIGTILTIMLLYRDQFCIGRTAC